jgi:hypothetical protein
MAGKDCGHHGVIGQSRLAIAQSGTRCPNTFHAIYLPNDATINAAMT